MDRIRTIIDKEWAEVFKNRAVILTVVIMPLIFTIMPLVMLYFMSSAGPAGTETTDMPAAFAKACSSDMDVSECMQVFVLNEFLLLYMMMPLAIPIAIAAYSIVGEKTTRSLEPLLATPISTTELLIGKSMAASIPAILATWTAFAIFIAATYIMSISANVRAYASGPIWLVAVILVGPLMAVAAVNLTIMVSSRVNDPRAAEQISMVLILPLLGVLFGQIAGVIILSVEVMLVFALVLLLADIGLVYMGARLFQRETILTHWK